MSPESLLQDFGYLAVFVGTFLEGEAILEAEFATSETSEHFVAGTTLRKVRANLHFVLDK